MLPHRTTVKFTRVEDRVLKCVLQGYSSKEASLILEIPKNTLNSIRKNIFHKLGAKSPLHLVVLAILEYKYYKVINPEKSEQHKTDNLTAKEVEVAKLLLQGYLNKEVASILDIGIRTVEFHRENFKNKTQSHNYPDFVRACLQNGFLKLIPVKARKATIEGKGEPNNLESFHAPRNFSLQSSHGWVYVDHRNRFIFNDFFDSPLRSYLQIDPLVTALHISGVSSFHISNLVNEEPVILEYQSKIIHEYARRVNYIYFLNKLVKLNVFEPVVSEIQLSRLFMLSRLLFIEHIAKSTSTADKLKILDLSENELREHENSVLQEFICRNEISLVVQAIHIGVLNMRNTASN